MLANQRTPIMQAAHVRRLRSRARRCESLARVARSYDETMRLLGLRAAYLIEAAIAAKVEQAAHHVSDSADNRPDAGDRCPVCGDWERFHAEGCPRHPQYRGYHLVPADDEVVPW